MKKWKVLKQAVNPKEKLSIDEIINTLLVNRGISTKNEKEFFLNPDLTTVTAASVGIDKNQLKKSILRIQKALQKNEQIIVFGDYDVDGITATAIVWETLHAMGAVVHPYIPSRMDEGYGLSVKGIENLTAQIKDVKVIITVDNGIVANEAVDFANTLGIDVIITDHHVEASARSLPNAYAIVHTTKLCGAGIAWLFSRILEGKEKDTDFTNDSHLELAALGTVADLVPLTGENRAIVKFGIEKLRTTKRVGLLALYNESGCDQMSVGVYQIGHIIAPRLNAAGRIEHGMDSLRLLCTRDINRAMNLAVKLGITNRERQNMMKDATEHATREFRVHAELRKILFIAHDEYQEGIIGLVAGKLVEEFHRPSIVISKKDSISKGSVRSISGFNIIEFLRMYGGKHFVNVGGHPMAAGFSIETDEIIHLKEVLEKKADELITDELLKRSITIDMFLPVDAISKKLFDAIQILQPFGMGNPEPVFQADDVILWEIKVIGKEGTHLKLGLKAQDSNTIIEAVAFGMGEYVERFKKNDLVSIAYTIDENTWNGNTKLQLKLKDIR